MVNVICMKWGKAYGAEYVNRLYGMVARHLTFPFRFMCLTDDAHGIRSEVESRPLPEIYIPKDKQVSPWRKVSLFSPALSDLEGKTLFLDLDILITQNIDCFFDYSERFCIIENWSQKGQGIGNSSVFCCDLGKYREVFEYYSAHVEEIVQTHDNEQIYVSKHIGDIDFWPDSWCQSFQVHCLGKGLMRYLRMPQRPKDAKIVVFHGFPNPDQALAGGGTGKGLRRLRKHVPATPWIAQYWKE